MTKRTARAAAMLAVPALFLAACGGSGEDGGDGGGGGGDGALTIATGGTGGVYYPLGGGIANVISKNVDGTSATAQETNASVDNMLLVEKGSADLALAVGDVVAAAAEGTGSFEEPLNLCAIGSMYHNYMQPVTTKDTGIESVEDMKGKTISIGAPGSATEVGAMRVLEAAGLDPEKDIERRQLGAAETVDALRDGTIDAGFWSGGIPTGALVDLASTGDMQLIEIGDYADELATEYGEYYVQQEIPADTYEGQSEPVSVIASPNILVANKDMDEQLQEDVTRAIFEHKDSLVQVHSAAKELDAATAGDVPFMETCPGSQTYYDEG